MPDEEYQPPPYSQPPPLQEPPPGYNAPMAWPPPPGGYYAAPGGYSPPPPANATLILVFGILGIVLSAVCGIGGVFGITAWIMGNNALRTLGSVGDPLDQRSTVQAGRICGIVATVLTVLVIVSLAALMALGLYAEKHPQGV